MTRVIKYFYDEPASLEVLTPDNDPDARRAESEAPSLEDFLRRPLYYRGYLTATDLDNRQFGFSTLPDGIADALLTHTLQGRSPLVYFQDERDAQTGLQPLVTSPADVTLALVGAGIAAETVAGILAAGDRRRGLEILRSVLDTGATVLFPEPAHDGIDWSIFAARPLRPSVEDALRQVISADVRAFSIPHVRARSEEKFYFELYDLERFEEWEIG